MNSKPKRQKGYTIIEVLLAAVIFSTGILLLFTTFTLALRFDLNSRDVTIANNVAVAEIDQLRLNGFDNITAPATTTSTVASLPQGQMKVITSVYNNNAKIKQVIVEVYWANRPEANAVTITTLVGVGGIHG